MKRRPFLLILVASASIVASGACLAPTLPLPPPEEPLSIQPAGADGQWTIQGNCTQGALVLLTNERTGAIVGFEDRALDGRYAVEMTAEACDPATVFELVGDDVSTATPFLIREVLNGIEQTACPGD
jgi:hypothetical protein